MSRIGIDVDGVLRDFCGDLETIIKTEYPQYIPKGVTDFKIDHWKISNCVSCSKEDIQQIYWHTHCDKIMANGNPMFGAIKKMYDLFDWGEKNGHTFVCITSQKPHARYHTLSWLGKYGLNFISEKVGISGKLMLIISWMIVQIIISIGFMVVEWKRVLF